MGALLGELPPLPPLLAGQVAQLVAEAGGQAAAVEAEEGAPGGAEGAAQHAGSSLPLPEGEASAAAAAAPCWRQWVAALQCLRALRPEQALALAPLQQGGGGGGAAEAAAARGVQLRCCLVLLGALSHRELAPCRAAALDLPPWGAQLGALLPLLGAACCSAPQAAQVQVLSEVLASGLVCRQPGSALQLFAAMAACLASHQGDSAALDCHISMAAGAGGAGVGGPAAGLAHALPALLRGAQWAPAAEALSAGLARLLRHVQQHGEVQGGGVAGALAGLAAVRDQLPTQAQAELLPWLAAQ
jgi:hypothetical protein